MQAFGAPPEVLQKLKEEPDEFQVLPENWDALMLFNRLGTQWRHAPDGALLGMDYAGVEAVLRLTGTRHKKRVFAQLQTIEQVVLDERG